MSVLLRLSPFLLAATVTGCTVGDYDRPSRVDGVPPVALADAAAGMIGDLSPNHFYARIGELPLGGHGEEEDHEEGAHDAAIGVEPEVGQVHGTARLDETRDGRLIYLDAEGFALRIEVMMPATAFADADVTVPQASAPVAGDVVVDLDEAGDGTAQVTGEAAAALVDDGEADALLDDGAGLTVLQTYAGESRLRASLVVDGVRMDSQSGEVHLSTIREDRLRGWFYFDVERISSNGLDNETERVYGAFDAVAVADMLSGR